MLRKERGLTTVSLSDTLPRWGGRLLLIVPLVCLGCGGNPAGGGSPATSENSAKDSVGSDISIAEPEAEAEAADPGWVEAYGDSFRTVSPSAAEKELLDSMGRSLRCNIDGRLSAAARYHAVQVLLSPDAVNDGEMDRLRYTLHKFGAYAYGVESATITLDVSSRAFLANLVENKSGGWESCGLGISTVNGRSLAVWVAVRPTPKVAPFPVRVRPGESIQIRAQPERGKEASSSLYVGLPDTTVVKFDAVLRGRGGRIEFVVPTKARGRYELELLYDTGHGPETVMLVPVFVGIEPDNRPTVGGEPKAKAGEDPEKVLLRLLNAARKRVGLTALRRDERLDGVAKAHSTDMAAGDFFGHVSPRFGGLARRLKAAALSPSRSGENIAGSATPYRIHRNLMGSPAHRINMLNPEFTHVGIGTAEKNDMLYGTEVYARW